MNIEKRLLEIWGNDYCNALPDNIKERGFCYCLNSEQRDILITGFNPSFREGDNPTSCSFDFVKSLNSVKYDNYFGPIRKMLFDSKNNIDLRSQTAYVDLFYFREQRQECFKKQILNNNQNFQFIIDQVNLTQNIIERVIRPKLIIVKNKESWAYFGKLFNEKGWVWMGYEFEFIQNMICGELFKISGLIKSNERVSPEITKTNLNNTLILFTNHITQYTSKEKRPTIETIQTLLDDTRK
ncbi:MAG: hypothetical protein GX273_01960 [Bacteroidales bacterium]|jgi:hypothetical protein|nr:hypothetical protein [Bacteroidales bacterium]